MASGPAPEPILDAAVAARSDSAATGHLLVSTLYLGLAALLTVAASVAMRFPQALSGPFSYGRLRPLAMTATMLGWLSLALVGGLYYVLPRLTGTGLWREDLANLNLWASAVVYLLGLAAVALGLGDGNEPFDLPWYLDILVLATLLVPTLIAIQTVRRRTERGSFVTIWYALAAVAWLPLLYVLGNLPRLAAVGRTLGQVDFTAGFANLWVAGMGAGLVYYAVVKTTDNPLANRQLARVGLWSLAFAAFWWGPAQLAFGPVPSWLGAVAATLTLALPVAAISTATNLAATIGDSWKDAGGDQVVATAAAGAAMWVALAAVAALASFGAASSVVGLSVFWDGIVYGMLFGVGGLWVASYTYQAIAPLTGRRLYSSVLARRHLRLTVVGVGGTSLFLCLAGVVAGYTAAGGAFTGAFSAVGDGWATAFGTASVLIGLSVATGLLAFAGQAAFVLNVFRTVTSGRATVQEVLVPRESADE